MRGFRSALAFLTIAGGPARPEPAARAWFAVVGAALGAVLGGAWWLAAHAWPASVAAAIVVAGDLALTGMLHLDGLADAADGLLATAPAPRRLEIMRTPDVGAYGVGVVAVTLLLRFGALAALSARPMLLVALWAVARAFVAAVPDFVPYARAEGAASAFVSGGQPGPVNVLAIAALGAAIVLAGVARGLGGVVAVAAAVAACVGVVAFARARVGGYTGDVLGAVVLVGETVGLVVAAAKW
jgi:adenosylcobinamide-GDP ribazoletransferase